MVSGDPFRTVRSGEKLRIPAAAYNAFVAAAKSHQRGRTGSEAEDAGSRLGFDTLILNQTGKDLPRFGVVSLGAPVTSPALRPAGFRARQAMTGIDPASDHRGRFAIAQEPIRAGAIGRALSTGITIARVELLAPSSEDDDFADVKGGDSDVLLAAGSGSARILWIEPLGDRDIPDALAAGAGTTDAATDGEAGDADGSGALAHAGPSAHTSSAHAAVMLCLMRS